jgi:hypothetical protein
MKISSVVKILILNLLFLHLGNAQGEFFKEEFNGGLPQSWRTVKVLGNNDSTANWFYTTTGASGEFPTPKLASASASNGWMIFDSDKNCNIGVGQNAWLISPEIDASNKEEVFLIFETNYRSFYDRPQIRVGTDLNNLNGWATIEVFPGIGNNDFSGKLVGDPTLNPHVVKFDLTQWAAGKSSFYFAFQFLSDSSIPGGGNNIGCGYAWQIDDVRLTSENPKDKHDLRLREHNVAASYATPLSQVDSFLPIVVVSNEGSQDQTNVTVEVVIEQENKGVVYTFSKNIGTLEAGESDLLLADSSFLPQEEGGYLIVYAVSQDSTDAVPGNNVIEQPFIVTDNLFSKDDGQIVTALAPQSSGSDIWEGGNYYYIPQGGFMASKAFISVASNPNNPHAGKTASVLLYKIEEDSDSTSFKTSDTEIVGFGSYEFTDEEDFDIVEVELFGLSGEEPGIELEEDGEYILMVQYTSEMFAAASELTYDYNLATIIKDGETWFLGGFSGGNTLLIRMQIDSMTATSVKSLVLLNNQVNVFPNPASEFVQLDYNFEVDSDEIWLDISTLEGKTISHQKLGQNKTGRVQIDTSRWIPGNYLFRLTTKEGIAVKKVSIQR